jgi:hypothetical protein
LKRSAREWEKIFAIYTSDKVLIITIYRELKKLNSPKINDLIKKGQLNKIELFQRKKSKWIKNT